MTRFAVGAIVALALLVWAAPAGAVGSRSVAPDGRSVTFATETPFVAADTDAFPDAYGWSRGVFSLAAAGPHTTLPEFISDDGARVIFQSGDALDPADTDTSWDLYETAGGVTSLVSTGPADPGDGFMIFRGASENGTRVYFETAAPLVAGDTDTQTDIYLRTGGSTTLVSASPAGSDGTTHDHQPVAVSRNGERVIDLTTERMTAEDTDSEDDLYEYFGGATTLISKGPVVDSTPSRLIVRGATPDAKSIAVLTQERFTSGDTNEEWDMYQFSRGRTTMVSSRSDGSSPACPGEIQRRVGLEQGTRSPPCEPFLFGQTDTGSKVLFYTRRPLDSTPGPLGTPSTDETGGLFEKSADGTIRLIDEQADLGGYGAIAADGSRYVVVTLAQRSPADTDDKYDIYLVEGATSTLVSGEAFAYHHGVVEVSRDARRVFWKAFDPLVPEDTDTDDDVYVNTDAGPRLALTGPADTDPDGQGEFIGASETGDRWFFLTTRRLVAEDTDAAEDLYQRHLDGTTRLLSP